MHELELITVPEADEPDTALVYVDGRIGDRPYRFLLDTGAAKSSVVFDDYTATFESSEQEHSSGVFAKHSSDRITVPSLEVGSLAWRDFTLTRAGEPDPRASSIAGMDVLKDFRCHFRFHEQRVLVDDNAPYDGEFETLLMDARFHPYIEVSMGTAHAQAVWDTGASLTVVNMDFIHAHPEHFEPAGHSFGTDSTGATLETPMYVMAETTIGARTFPQVRVAGVDLSQVNAHIEIPMDMILGYNILSRACWLFDFPRRQWAITEQL